MKKQLLAMVYLLLTAAGTLAANHWTLNEHQFQYDMTAYVSLALAQQEDYEVAAFCDGECRGVGKLLTAADGTQVFQLRIRSNTASGEVITFRAYNTTTEEELHADQDIAFEAQSVVGTPSEPLSLQIGLMLNGDTNGDGEINTVDASYILMFLVGNTPEDFVEEAADVDGSGDISTVDATRILQMLVE